MLLVSSYFMSGVGLNRFNGHLLATVAQSIEAADMPFVWAADFNMNPQLVAKSDIQKRLNAAIVAPAGPTCRSGLAANTIDFFISDTKTARAVEEINVRHEHTFPPHWPVQL